MNWDNPYETEEDEESGVRYWLTMGLAALVIVAVVVAMSFPASLGGPLR